MSLLPAKASFSAWKGATFRKSFTLYTGADTSTPVRDLTNHTATCIIYDAEDAVLHNVQVTLGGVAGTIDLYISDENTAAFTWQSGTFELLLTDASGDVDPILFGTFVLKGI